MCTLLFSTSAEQIYGIVTDDFCDLGTIIMEISEHC